MSQVIRGKDVLAQIKNSRKNHKVDREGRVNFDFRDMQPQTVYVAWIDIMGTSEKMASRLTLCAKDIGRFYAAVFQACQTNASSGDVTLHTLVDGAYIVSTSATTLKQFLGVVMCSLTETFLEASFENRFLVRAAVARGDIITAQDMSKRLLATKSEEFKRVTSNAALGTPFANAYTAEHEAPPLGVYVHQSARGADSFAKESVWPWWESFDDVSWLPTLSKFICMHFDRLGNDYYVRHLPIAKVTDYKAKVRSYFRRTGHVRAGHAIYFNKNSLETSAEVAGPVSTVSVGCVVSQTDN